MDTQQFLAEFGHIANAPGGVARLRELILHLAITGKVVPQIESDFEAHAIIEKMRDQASKSKPKNRATSKKKTISGQHISESKIPSNWVVADLGELGDWGAGSTPSRSNSIYYGGTIPWFKSGELKADLISVAEEHVSDLALKECSLRLNSPGDVLIAMYGANIGQTSIIEVESTTNQAVCACTPYKGLSNRFLLITLKALKRFFIGLGAGGAQPNISKEKIIATRIGLPPTEEQSRIVAKVDELMALCDQLEAQQQDRRTLQNQLRQATLQAVAASQSPYELQKSWQRLQGNFGQLFSAPEDVADLRQIVFDLAVSGRLSEFSESDKPSDVLREEILSAKEFGVTEGSFSRKKQVKSEDLEETILPSHWETITLNEAISTIDAGWSPACLPSVRTDENKWAVLKTTAVQVLRFLPNEHKELPTSLEPRPQYQIEVGDILITRAGPKNRVGICCVVDDAPPKLMISDKLIRFHIVNDLINPNFVALCLSAGESARIVERLKSGMADSQMNISQDKLRSITIPLPPIEEQHRILEKVDAFMGIVNRYSEKLAKHLRLAEQVANVTIFALTGIAIEQEEEPMKAPQTELVAPVRLGTPPDVKAQAPLATILARHTGEMSAKDLWQRFGGDIDVFYAQLKTEVAHGWILEPKPAEMREKLDS